MEEQAGRRGAERIVAPLGRHDCPRRRSHVKSLRFPQQPHRSRHECRTTSSRLARISPGVLVIALISRPTSPSKPA